MAIELQRLTTIRRSAHGARVFAGGGASRADAAGGLATSHLRGVAWRGVAWRGKAGESGRVGSIGERRCGPRRKAEIKRAAAKDNIMHKSRMTRQRD